MSAGPDILVLSADQIETMLIVAVRSWASVQDEGDLRRWMVARRSPTGLLVDGRDVSVYRNDFPGGPENRIRKVSWVATKRINVLQRFAANPNLPEEDAKDSVQHWLEDSKWKYLSGLLGVGDLPRELRKDLLPVLAMGEIRSAGPRPRRRAAG